MKTILGLVLGVWAMSGVALADGPVTVADMRGEVAAIQAQLPVATESGDCALTKTQVDAITASLKKLDIEIAALDADATGFRDAARSWIGKALEIMDWGQVDCANRMNRLNVLLEGYFSHMDSELMCYQHRDRLTPPTP